MLRAIAPLASAFVCFAGFAGFAAADEGEAAEHTLFGKPVFQAPELSEEEIEARQLSLQSYFEEKGWEQHGDVVGPPELFADGDDPQAALNADWDYPPHRATIFLNFFGGEMTGGTNASLMQSNCIQGTRQYPGFVGSEAMALAIIETFQSKLEPYGVRVAYEEAPPPELPYQMVMMGGKPGDVGFQNGTLGVSCSSDCGDRWWRDTTLAFTASSNQTTILATTALQEAAHAFGLGHIDGSNHIMYPFATSGAKVWSTECTIYNDATGGINCKPTHDIWCGGGAQNDDAELMAYFGSNTPDTEAPVVEIVSPPDGLEIEAGGSVEVEANITDNHDGAGWKIMIYKDGELVEDKPSFLFESKWPLSGLPAGEYLIRVQAIDHDRNIGADEVTVHVGTPSSSGTGSDTDASGGSDTDASGTGGTGGTGGTDGSDGSDGSAGTVGGSATAGETAGDEDPEGCACVSGERPASGGLWLLAGLLGLLGRRRRQ
jgi:MYXO-CTERM domain-containing protein